MSHRSPLQRLSLTDAEGEQVGESVVPVQLLDRGLRHDDVLGLLQPHLAPHGAGVVRHLCQAAAARAKAHNGIISAHGQCKPPQQLHKSSVVGMLPLVYHCSSAAENGNNKNPARVFFFLLVVGRTFFLEGSC
jgi:hypothetical protein